MNVQLPPERNLPPHALREIESALVTEVTVGARGRRRRWLVPAAAAVAVLVVLGVGVGALRSGERDTVRPAASAHPWPSMPPAPTGRAARIEAACQTFVGSGGTAAEQALAKATRLYNLDATPSGALALLYSPYAALFCSVDGDSTVNTGGRSPLPWLDRISSPYEIDASSASESTEASTKITTVKEAVAGRISEDVARVTVEAGGVVVRAHLQNGTFVAALQYQTRAPRTRVIVRAYDATGKQLPPPGSSTVPWP